VAKIVSDAWKRNLIAWKGLPSGPHGHWVALAGQGKATSAEKRTRDGEVQPDVFPAWWLKPKSDNGISKTVEIVPDTG